jgi:hypothetical protein
MVFKSAIEIIYKKTVEDITEWYVLSKQGYTYNLNDVTEEGLVYILNDWYQIFISDEDLTYIQNKKREEELEEAKLYYNKLKKLKRVKFNDRLTIFKINSW